MTLPEENLDNKMFDELVKEAIARVPVYAPDWTDHNIHDPGRTFIELFAWLTEMQLYRLNKITDKNKRKFLKLMGMPKLRPARQAEVDVTFYLKPSINQRLVPAGTMVAVRGSTTEGDILFETKQDLLVVDANLTKIFSHRSSGRFIDNSDANTNKNVYYYAFSYDPDTGECDPKVGDELYLGFNKSLKDKGITLAFYLFEEDIPKKGGYCKEKTDLSASIRLSWEYYTPKGWKSVEDIRDETKNLTASGKIYITVQGEMEQTEINNAKNLFWLRSRVKEAGYEIPPRIDYIILNTVPAAHAIQRTDTNSCTGLPDYHFGLKYTPVLDDTLTVIVKEISDGGVKEITWSRVEDFDASKPGDRHYTADPATGLVSFGNGINGMVPPEGDENIVISYNSGGGARGNIKPKTITKVLGVFANEVTVENIKAASGGEEAEGLEEAIHRARKELKTVSRAVTSKDYEDLAMNTPGLKIARAKSIPRYHPKKNSEVPGIVTIVVIPKTPYAKPKPSAGFIKTVYKHLDKYRLLTTELFVIGPEYVEVSVGATVRIKLKSHPDKVKKEVEEKIKNFLNPTYGGIDGTGWPFGRHVYLSEIYQIIDKVEGVDYVKTVTLKKDNIEQTGDVSIPTHSLVYPGIIEIKAEE